MSSRIESSNSSLSSRTSLQRKRKRRRSNKSVSSECQTNDEKTEVKSLWYWSNYYKALIWQNRHEVEIWKTYALALEYEKTYLLQELQRQRELYKYGNRTFQTFTWDQAQWENSPEFENVAEDSTEENESVEENESTEEDENIEENGSIEEDENIEENGSIEENESTEENGNIEEYESTEENGNIEEYESTEEDGNIEEYESIEENEGTEEGTEDEEIEFEMSEEMIQFFEESIRRKLEMKQLKEKEAEQFELEVKELKEAHENREKEMKLLYGEGSCMIIGMETAVQLSYDKYCDLKSPSYWPNIPLNLSFP